MSPVISEYVLPVCSLLLCAGYAAALMSRLGVLNLSLADGPREKHSLMNLSQLGTLHCICDPTDAAEPRNDRRRSCRGCGNGIRTVEPMGLYAPLSRLEIRYMVHTLRHAARDAGRYAADARVFSLAEVRAAAIED